MIEKIKYLTNKKSFHVAVVIVIIALILCGLGVVVLKYNVEGETNMPFVLSKIAIISSSEGINKDATDSKWKFDLNQSNDIYIYIDKNSSYGKTMAIKSINVDNINIESDKKENVKLYKPDAQSEKTIFKYSDEDIVENLEYLGDIESNLKNLKVSNQGGVIAFRCSNNNVIEYKSDEEEIKHNELLKKAGITNEQLKIGLSFDLTLVLEDGKEFKTNISLDLPNGDVVGEGTTSTEITDLTNFIFKRVKNVIV